MSAFLSAQFTKYGLIDVDDSPATRVYVNEVHSDSQATVRTIPERDTDTEGATIFHGFRSEVQLANADLNGHAQAETWMTDYSDVELVGVTPDHLVQWYNPARIVSEQALDVSESNLAESVVGMVQDGGDQSSHQVYVTRNGLLDLAPKSGGWADTDGNNTPDGYTESSLNTTAFSDPTYEGFVDTGAGTGSLNVTIPFPLDSVDVTLSAQHTQIHDDGTQAIRIEALDGSKSLITGGFTDVSVSSTGRKHADLTTPSGTYYLKLYPVRVTSVSSNTTKFKIENPCLRVDGGTSYVKR